MNKSSSSSSSLSSFSLSVAGPGAGRSIGKAEHVCDIQGDSDHPPVHSNVQVVTGGTSKRNDALDTPSS